ncbi:hypothetical protein HKCCE4037_18530 [Rhodobacterales bacterium HKCCE4037]|nr:hypothetical protein [Rhodobacterales bacterium HKCCE4037]
MSDDDSDMVACRTPTEGRDGVTRIPAWKYDLLKKAILHAVTSAGPEGLPFSALPGALRQRISDRDLARIGSLGWHATTVKLNMEVEGELRRTGGKGPQRLVLGE